LQQAICIHTWKIKIFVQIRPFSVVTNHAEFELEFSILFLDPLQLHTFYNIFLDIDIKLIRNIDVLTIAEAHIRKVNDHHHYGLFINQLGFLQIKYFENVGI
jgi:hypothetical protein